MPGRFARLLQFLLERPALASSQQAAGCAAGLLASSASAARDSVAAGQLHLVVVGEAAEVVLLPPALSVACPLLWPDLMMQR